MLFIRADANSKIGTGHIMRCLAIAKAAKKVGIDTTFISADQEAENLVKLNGFDYICLNSSWNQLDREIVQLKSIIQTLKINLLLIDSYYATESYLHRIGKCTAIIYMDDMNQLVYPVDILINYNIYADKIKYARYNLEKTKLLLGCNFVPLREEFQGKNHKTKEIVTDVLITTGGSDAYNVSGNLIQYLNKNNQYHSVRLHVAVGSFNIYTRELDILTEQYHNVVLHRNVTRMSELMMACDLAVSAGGSTLYELCACGIPTISFAFADNQLEGAHEFHKQDLIYYAGDVRSDLAYSLENIETGLDSLMNDRELREKLSYNMRMIVDGYGTDRIIKSIFTI